MAYLSADLSWLGPRTVFITIRGICSIAGIWSCFETIFCCHRIGFIEMAFVKHVI